MCGHISDSQHHGNMSLNKAKPCSQSHCKHIHKHVTNISLNMFQRSVKTQCNVLNYELKLSTNMVQKCIQTWCKYIFKYDETCLQTLSKDVFKQERNY